MKQVLYLVPSAVNRNLNTTVWPELVEAAKCIVSFGIKGR